MQAKSPCLLRIDDDARFSSLRLARLEKNGADHWLKCKNRKTLYKRLAVFYWKSERYFW
jgi:hypothetical protein